jgi:hypothetical protein
LLGLLGLIPATSSSLSQLRATANNQGAQGLPGGIASVYQKTQIVTQLLGLSAPNWDATIPALGVGSDSCYGYLDLSPLRCCCCDPRRLLKQV